MKIFIGLLIILVSSSGQISGTSLSGIVFTDTNGNGLRDKNENGIKGVTVSDQVNVVVTDANGFYQIPTAKGFGVVFISLPQGYKATRSFYSKIDLERGNSQVDFALTKIPGPTHFKFIHASDTHIEEKSLDRMRKFQALVDSIKPDFVIVTGDLVADALRVPEKQASSLYEMYKSETQRISVPVWNAPGNHELFGIERELSLVSVQHPLYGRKMYRHYMGPDYYSFNYGGFHFVALNSLEYDDMWYYGSVDSVQREWLKKDLAAVPATVPVITFQHVPFISGAVSVAGYTEAGPGRTLEREKGTLKLRHVVSNAHDVITIIQSHPFPLALGGHHHARQRYYLETEGQQTRFEQSGAVVGPSSQGGFKMPSGIVVYEVMDGEIDEGQFVVIR